MEIKLNRDTFVDKRTGEETAPSEFLDNLRDLEEQISRADDDIAGLKADLKTAREVREKIIMKLRSAVRAGTVLPLFDSIDHDIPTDDGEPT